MLTVWDLYTVLLWPIKQLRDLRGKSGLFWDHIWTFFPIETQSRNGTFSEALTMFSKGKSKFNKNVTQNQSLQIYRDRNTTKEDVIWSITSQVVNHNTTRVVQEVTHHSRVWPFGLGTSWFQNVSIFLIVLDSVSNKLAKAPKMRKPPGTLGLKKFGPGKFWVEKVRNTEKVEEKLRKWKKKWESWGKTEKVEVKQDFRSKKLFLDQNLAKKVFLGETNFFVKYFFFFAIETYSYVNSYA